MSVPISVPASVSVINVIISAAPPSRLDKALARDVPEEAALSRTRLARLIADGAVTVGGVVVTDVKAKLSEGDEVTITVPAAQDYDVMPEQIALNIVHEDDDLIVVNKPAGMVVHPAPGTPSGTLVNALLHHFGGNLSGIGGEKRPGIVHRIDKDTSGLLVVAKSDRAHHGLAAQFEAHSARRAYQAVCYGMPDTGDPRLRGMRGVSVEQGGVICITSSLARHRTERQKQAVFFDQGRHAVTRLQMIEPFGTPSTAALVECRLQTGRTHQIRVHMAYVGHGLIGDPVYGGRRKLSAKSLSDAARTAVSEFSRQALHAAELGFVHPVTNEQMMFTADLPDDMAALVAVLRSSTLAK